MSTPTNIPETPMGEAEQDSFFRSKEKFQQQLQDIFQTTLRLTRPDQFDQLCQWMEYNQYLTIEDFYHSSYNDPEKFDTKGPATEYKWKGNMNHLSANVAQKLKSFVRWMTHEDRPYELHDDFLATLTRERYLKFRHMNTLSFSASSPSHHEPSKLKTSFSGESKHPTPSESQTALNNYKKGPQRKAFFSQQEEISDDDEYANAEEQFSTDPEPEEHSPYSVYQSSFHPKVPQKYFFPPNIWETLSESTKQMVIEHNKKVKLNNPTPYPAPTKPNLTLGKPTPTSNQVHQHSHDEPTEEPPSDTSTQTLVNQCLADSGIDPTDIQNVMSVSYANRNISSHESSRQIQTHQRYVFARVNQSNHHLIDRGANGGLAGADMRVFHTTPRKINIVGIDDHELTGLNVSLLQPSWIPKRAPSLEFFMNMPTLGKAGLLMLLVKWNGSTAKLMTDQRLLVVHNKLRHLKGM